MMFRYSAITFNAHRIHYDAAYTRETEGYPDLVVNGGLTTLLLWQLATSRSGRLLKSSASRNLKPLFINQPITLCGRAEGDEARLWALDSQGVKALEAKVELSA